MKEENEDEPNLRGSAGGQVDQGRIKDHELLLCGSSFLFWRTGRSSMERPDISSLLAEGVCAYGERGRDNVMAYLEARATSFPSSVLSVTASPQSTHAAVLVEYHDGSGETIRCGRDAQKRVVVKHVDTYREPATTSSSSKPSDKPTGVEQLWWAVRFLHADLSRDYAAQRRYLAPEAGAFGAVGREAILTANGEQLSEEQKPIYSVPYPLTVDESSGTVVLMFDKWTKSGELVNRGTDLMVVSEGLVQRIVTINHSSGVVYSPQSVEA